MSDSQFKLAIIFPAVIFLLFFLLVVVPASLEMNDIYGAFAAGFVNPFASGYSIDVIMCWFILAAWIVHEKRTLGIRRGWICCLLGIIPGVAVGFALYLIMRQSQLGSKAMPVEGH